MVTFHSEDAPRLRIPPQANPEEAAAIVAALSRHLASSDEESVDQPWWVSNPWRLAGRLEAAGHREVDVTGPPQRSAWVASARLGRE